VENRFIINGKRFKGHAGQPDAAITLRLRRTISTGYLARRRMVRTGTIGGSLPQFGLMKMSVRSIGPRFGGNQNEYKKPKP